MKIVIDPAAKWWLGKPDADWRYLAINESPAHEELSNTYDKLENINPILTQIIEQWSVKKPRSSSPRRGNKFFMELVTLSPYSFIT